MDYGLDNNLGFSTKDPEQIEKKMQEYESNFLRNTKLYAVFLAFLSVPYFILALIILSAGGHNMFFIPFSVLSFPVLWVLYKLKREQRIYLSQVNELKNNVIFDNGYYIGDVDYRKKYSNVFKIIFEHIKYNPNIK